jgi:hypothetical protein
VSRDPNRVWAGSQHEHAKLTRKIDQASRRITNIKTRLAVVSSHAKPDGYKTRFLQDELAAAIRHHDALQRRYDEGCKEWGA